MVTIQEMMIYMLIAITGVGLYYKLSIKQCILAYIIAIIAWGFIYIIFCIF